MLVVRPASPKRFRLSLNDSILYLRLQAISLSLSPGIAAGLQCRGKDPFCSCAVPLLKDIFIAAHVHGIPVVITFDGDDLGFRRLSRRISRRDQGCAVQVVSVAL